MLRKILYSVFATLLAAGAVFACMTATPAGFQASLSSEKSLIIYNPATQSEDFIRQAYFESSSSKIGFIVPTPTQPIISAVSADVFPEVEYTLRNESEATLFATASKSAIPAMQIHDRGIVAGYHAFTITGGNSKELHKWLSENNFKIDQLGEKYLVEYLNKKYCLNAFVFENRKGKINSSLVSRRATTNDRNFPLRGQMLRNSVVITAPLIDLKFKSENIYYPYREPLRPIPGNRSTEIYVITTRPVQAVDIVTNSTVLEPENSSPISKNIFLSQNLTFPDDAFVTAFSDTRQSRNGLNDIIFSLVPDKNANAPIIYVIGAVLIFCCGIAFWNFNKNVSLDKY